MPDNVLYHALKEKARGLRFFRTIWPAWQESHGKFAVDHLASVTERYTAPGKTEAFCLRDTVADHPKFTVPARLL